MSDYIIQGETLTGLGDQVRRITDASSAFTPAQMISKVKELSLLKYETATFVMNHIGSSVSAADISLDGDLFSNGYLLSADLPTVEYIGDETFFFCTSLASINLPAATSIGSSAFAYCAALTSVSLPAAEYIGDQAFEGCTALTSVSLPAATSIGSGAFSGRDALTSISLPAAEYIGDQAFEGCTALTSVSLPAATSIGANAFESCTALTAINLPVAMSIGESAFDGCAALASVTLPTEANIEAYAFSDTLYPNDHIVNMYFYGSSVGSCNSSIFGDFYSLISGNGSHSNPGEESESAILGLSIYVPASLLSEFQTTWADGVFSLNIFPHPSEA